MSQMYIFLADGFEEIEALTVVDMVRRVGLDITTVSIHDTTTVTSSHNVTVKADQTIAETDFSKADMLILPGGMPGTIHLSENETLCEQLKAFNEEGKMVAAICAAPSVLGSLGILKGKKAVCHPGFEEKLIGAEVLFEPAVTDDNVITSRGMGTAIEFASEIIRHYLGQEKVDELSKAIIWNH